MVNTHTHTRFDKRQFGRTQYIPIETTTIASLLFGVRVCVCVGVFCEHHSDTFSNTFALMGIACSHVHWSTILCFLLKTLSRQNSPKYSYSKRYKRVKGLIENANRTRASMFVRNCLHWGVFVFGDMLEAESLTSECCVVV